MTSIKCLERALDILDLIYRNGGKMTLTEISSKLDLYKSTVLRTLSTLSEKDFVQRDEYTGAYLLGSRVFMLGMVAAHSIPIAKIGRPHLEYLSEKYEEFADLSVLDNGIERNGVKAENIDRNFVVVFQQYLNETYTKTLITPNQCENSDVFLPAVYTCFVAYTIELSNQASLMEHYIKIKNRKSDKKWSYEEFISEISTIKKNGYSYQDADLKNGKVCIAAPIFDVADNLIAVISMRGSRNKFSKTTLENVISDITHTAAVITELCKKL